MFILSFEQSMIKSVSLLTDLISNFERRSRFIVSLPTLMLASCPSFYSFIAGFGWFFLVRFGLICCQFFD